jgi:DNA-binding NarL/FixJ family response regulator
MNGTGTRGQVISFDHWAAHRTGGDRSPAIRVLLADGAALVRAGLRALLEEERGIAVIAEAASGEEVVAVTIETRPDVVLMDVGLPGLDALEATRRILTHPDLSHVRVLVVGACESDEDLFGALRAGASGFLVKDTEPGELLRAVRVVAGGGAQLSPSVTRRLLREFASQPDPKRPVLEQLEELTAREREVLTLVALGLSNDEIAERLVVSPATAKTHVSHAMVKLHAHDRAKLVALAYETGFVQPRQHASGTGFVQPAHRVSHVGLSGRYPGKSVAAATDGRPPGASADLRVRPLRAAGAEAGCDPALEMRRGCLIVDDNASFLEASRTLLERQGLTVTGVARSAAEGLTRAAELKPRVILIDIELGDDTGFALARELAQTADLTPANVVLISAHREEDYADLIAESPALGFIAKSHLSKRAIEHILEDRPDRPNYKNAITA